MSKYALFICFGITTTLPVKVPAHGAAVAEQQWREQQWREQQWREQQWREQQWREQG
jgi:hypothetical protein